MKKFLLFIFIAMSFSLIACQEAVTHEQVFAEKLIVFNDTDDVNNVTGDFELLVKSRFSTVEIEWISSNANIVRIEGNKGVVTSPNKDTIITLTIKVTIKEVTKQKYFPILVKGTTEDIIPPVISGYKNLIFTKDTTEPDYLQGVTATDNVDGEVDVYIKENDVNLTKIGTYDLVYGAKDKAGNENTVSIKVEIVDSNQDFVAPVIYDYADLTITVGSTDPDYFENVYAIDDVDGEVEVFILENEVDVNTVGIYRLVYAAKDKADNQSSVEIEVYVVAGSEKTYTENFETVPSSGSSYTNITFIGANNVKWEIYGSRTDEKLDNLAVTFAGKKDSSKIKAQIDGGISSFSVDVKRAYVNTNNRELELLINGVSKGKFTVNTSSDEIAKFTVNNINVSGAFTLELLTTTGVESRAQITIDNLTWTSYSGNTIPVEQENLNKDLKNLNIITSFIEPGTIELPAKGINGSTIEWKYQDSSNTNNALINLESKMVTMPTSGQVIIVLEAKLTNGDFETTKSFSIRIGEGEPIPIESLLTLPNNTKAKVGGVITSFYETNDGIYFFMEDSTGGLFVLVSLDYRSSIVVGNVINLIGVKTTLNNQLHLNNVSKIDVTNTKIIEKKEVTNPDNLSINQGRFVYISGVLKQSYGNLTTSYILVNQEGSFNLVIPSDLGATLTTSIQNLFANKVTGIKVEVSAGVLRYNNTYQLLLVNPTDIKVEETINKEYLAGIISKKITLPANNSSVSKNLNLPTTSNILNGITINWTSSNPNVISNTGVVYQQDEQITVSLTYEIFIDNNFIATGYLNLIVQAKSTYSTYYESLIGMPDSQIKSELTRIISNMKSISYTNTSYILDETDADPNRPGNILLIYNRASVSGKWDGANTWNKEHVWPQSKLGGASKSDLHNLRPANPKINSTRGNLPFVEGSGSYGTRSGGWFPGEEDKGDVARIIFYMNTRWGLQISIMGNLQTFIKWHNEDPVDDFEINRNNVIYDNQKNRNPYIDYPELVDVVYGSYSIKTIEFHEIPQIKYQSNIEIPTYLISLSDLNRKSAVA